MRIIATTLAVTAMLVITGCATDVSTPETVRQVEKITPTKANKTRKSKGTDFDVVKSNVEFLHHPHIGGRSAKGPQIKYRDPERNKWLDGYNIYNLIGVDAGRSGANIVNFSDVQLRIEQTSMGDWPFYNAAYSAGERLRFKKIDSDVSCLGYGGGCYKKEIVGIDMTMDQLREISERQIFAVKVVGKGNSMIVEIPQSYIKGFLAAIDEKETTGY